MISNLEKEIIKNSLSWVGTNFELFCARKKNLYEMGGCDCFSFIISVLIESGLNNLQINLNQYIKTRTHSFVEISNLINFKEIFEIQEFIFEKKNNFLLKESNILCFEIEKDFFHLAIITSINQNQEKINIIHSFSKVGYVCVNFLNNFWLKKLKFIFSIKNL
jgi:hypothetical protein